MSIDCTKVIVTTMVGFLIHKAYCDYEMISQWIKTSSMQYVKCIVYVASGVLWNVLCMWHQVYCEMYCVCGIRCTVKCIVYVASGVLWNVLCMWHQVYCEMYCVCGIRCTLFSQEFFFFYTMRPEVSGRHFANNIFRCILLNYCILVPISIKCVRYGPVEKKSVLIGVMVWCTWHGKPLP